jgi:hypothetical protein
MLGYDFWPRTLEILPLKIIAKKTAYSKNSVERDQPNGVTDIPPFALNLAEPGPDQWQLSVPRPVQIISASYAISASVSISVRTGLLHKSPPRGRIRLFHIANDGPPTIMDMHMLDANKLLPAVTQASKNLNLHRICFEQTSRSRSERCNSPLCCEGHI